MATQNGTELQTKNTVEIDGSPWFLRKEDFGNVLCFSYKNCEKDDDLQWRGIGYIENVKTKERIDLYCIHYANNAGMCAIQTLPWPFEQSVKELEDHMNDFTKKFPSGSEMKFYSIKNHPYVRIPTCSELEVKTEITFVPPEEGPQPDTPSQPVTVSEAWTFFTDDSNTTIINNGNAFKNTGSEICWSKGKSNETHTSGTHTAVFKIDQAKEYGGKCSNTYVGLYSATGSKTCHISGDGNIHGGSSSKADTNAEFKSGDTVTVTFNCDTRKVSWKVGDKSTVESDFPSEFSGAVGVFAQVIQKGNSISFGSGSAQTLSVSPSAASETWTFETDDKNTTIINNGNAFKNTGSDICWSKGKSKETHTSGTHTAVFKIDQAKEYGSKCTNTYVGLCSATGSKTCYISGDGKIHGGSSSKTDTNAQFKSGDTVTVTFNCDTRQVGWKVGDKPIVESDFPSEFSGAVGVFAQVIQKGNSISFGSGSALNLAPRPHPTVSPTILPPAPLVGDKWTFFTDDKNTTIIDNGNAFKNTGSEICWSKGKSNETHTSGTHTAVFKIDQAKEYGSKCTNTYVGLYSATGSKTCHISGDGDIHGGSSSKTDANAQFKSGDTVTVTFNCDTRKVSWKVGDKPTVESDFPSEFSGAVGVFAQVIQKGNSISFGSGNAQTLSVSPSAASETWTFETDDKNTTIINNGNAFKNTGSDICWSKGKSKETHTSGTHTAVFKIDQAKEYGSKCTNTYVGLYSATGSKTCHISGDGKIHGGSSSKTDANAQFKSGDTVTVTFNCDTRKVSWKVGDKPTVESDFPSEFSGAVGVFAQVIQKGNSISFGSGSAQTLSVISLAPLNAKELKPKGDFEIKVTGTPWFTTQDFGQVLVFNVPSGTPSETSTKWRGVGYLENASTGEKFANFCIHYFNNSKMCFVQTLAHPWNNPKSVLDEHIKKFQKVFPEGAVVKFYSVKDEPFTRVPSKDINQAPKSPLDNLSPTTETAITSQTGAKIVVSGKPWFTNQNFGQCLVFRVKEGTSKDDVTKWRGVGVMKNASTGTTMPIYAIHFMNNATMCIVQTLESPFNNPKSVLDKELKTFETAFPNDASVLFFATKTEPYVRIPSGGAKAEIVSQKGAKIVVSGQPWFTHQNFGYVLVFRVQSTAADEVTQWRGVGYIENQSSKEQMPIHAIHCMNRATMCFIQTFPDPFKRTTTELNEHLDAFKKKFASGSHIKFFATQTVPYTRIQTAVLQPLAFAPEDIKEAPEDFRPPWGQGREITSKIPDLKLIVDSKPWITTQDFGQVIVFNVKKGTTSETSTTWRGYGYIENVEFGDRMSLFAIHYFNNANMCFIQTLAVPWDHPTTYTNKHIDTFVRRFPIGTEVKFYSLEDRPYVRVPPRKREIFQSLGPQALATGTPLVAVGEKWTFEADDKNTTIINNGNAFKNTGSDICWSKGKSKETHTSGTHTAVFKIDQAKEYGGKCSNTYVGIISGSKTCHISGDGNIHGGSSSKADTNAEFKSGDTVTVTFNCDTRKVSWKVGDKPTVESDFPSEFSGAVGVFAQVIQKGNSISFGSGATTVSALPPSKITRKPSVSGSDSDSDSDDSFNLFSSSETSSSSSSSSSLSSPTKNKGSSVYDFPAPTENGTELKSTLNANIVVKGDPWITTQDFGQILVFNVQQTAVDTTTQWRGFGYIENPDTKERMPIWCIHYFNNASMCFVQTLEVPWNYDKKVLDEHLKVFKKKFPDAAPVKFYSINSDPSYTRIPPKTTPKNTILPGPWTFEADDKNTTIINNGNAFKNTGGDICWSKGKSKETHTSGTHTAVFKIDRAKEYGGKCSNTYIGITCGAGGKTCYISGDGNVNTTVKITNAHAEFKSGDTVTVTFDCSTRKVSWKVNDKPPVQSTIPSDFSGPIGVFAQVIQKGDSISFERGPVSSIFVEPATPTENGTELKSTLNANIVVKGKPWITTQDFGQILVFNVQQTAVDTTTQWRGFGYIENPDTKERMPIWCIHYFNNASMCFVQTFEVPWNIPQPSVDEHLKLFEKKFPAGSKVQFYALKTLPYSRIPSKSKPDLSDAKDQSRALNKITDFDPPSETGPTIDTKVGEISVIGDPWITTQDFGQVLVFKTSASADTTTQWRGFGYIENVSTKERMPIWCVHYVSNAKMCFVQTLEVPWNYEKDSLDEHLKVFKKKFPSGSKIELHYIKSGTYSRIPPKTIPELTGDYHK